MPQLYKYKPLGQSRHDDDLISIWFPTRALIYVKCSNCYFDEADMNRIWEGVVTGKGIHGSVSAVFITVENKLSNLQKPMIELLTLCKECCKELELFSIEEQLARIQKSQDSWKVTGRMNLALPHQQVEELTSSKEIVMKGVLMNRITTIGTNDEEKEWKLIEKRVMMDKIEDFKARYVRKLECIRPCF